MFDFSIESLTGNQRHVAPKSYSLRERLEFHSMPEPNSGCWLWTAGVDRDGYGMIWKDGKQKRAHRVSYEEYAGPISEGLQIDHLCRVPCCINPSHLEPVTSRENTLRGISPAAKAARQTHCKRGHPLSGTNLLISPRKNRLCRTCRNMRARRLKRHAAAIRHSAAMGSGVMLQAMCSNKPRPSVHNNHSKGHQFWARDVHHIVNTPSMTTLCSRDASEWLPMEWGVAEAADDRNCCQQCAAAIRCREAMEKVPA